MDIQTIIAATVHDVKNSLGLIESQLSDTIRMLDLAPEHCQDLRRIQLECARINNDMVHMLGLFRIENDTFSPAFDDILVADVIQNAVSRHTAVLSALGIELITIQEDLDCLWYLDENLLEGLLANVITNSIRYTKSKISFNVEIIDGWLRIRITDDGNGYPKNLLTLLDEPQAISFSSGTTGMGLYFCQKIAEMHINGERKGYVSLSNREGSPGAIFDVWLP